MKKQNLAVLALAAVLPALSLAQTTPAVPPAPPVPAVPPPGAPAPDKDDDDANDRAPKVPVTYLGVETSDVPSVVAEQLGLAKGFGLVVDYVVPDGPAAAAGVQPNDILKMLNDQILTEPDQLGKLIRSMAEGTSVTLTVLRKGAETKLTAKLGKREIRQRRHRPFDHNWRPGKRFGNLLGPEFEQEMQALGDELGKMDFSMFDENAMKEMRENARVAQREARQAAREAQQEAREASREAARAARDAARQFRVSRRENGALKTTRIDMDKAQIVYHDAEGELKLENVAGKKILTAKDPQGQTVFSGPVDTKEELEKLPAAVRQRFEKLEQKDLPALAPSVTHEQEGNMPAEDAEEENESESVSVLQVTNRCDAPTAPSNFDLNIVLI